MATVEAGVRAVVTAAIPPWVSIRASKASIMLVDQK